MSLSNADLEPTQKHPGCILRSHSNCSHRPINKRGDDNLAFSAELPNEGTKASGEVVTEYVEGDFGDFTGDPQ